MSSKLSSGSVHSPVWAFIQCPGFFEPVLSDALNATAEEENLCHPPLML